MSLLADSLLILAGVAAAAAAVHASRVPLVRLDAKAAHALVQHRPRGPGVRPDSVIGSATRAAPFRLRRTLPAIRYDPERTGEAVAAAPPAPRPAKPTLVLSGIIWGAVPTAALEGIPGADGARLVVKGDTVGGLHIRRITQREVVVAGFDTTWVLTVGETWR